MTNHIHLLLTPEHSNSVGRDYFRTWGDIMYAMSIRPINDMVVEYLALGYLPINRQTAYRGLFDDALNADKLLLLRGGGFANGNTFGK